jgi:hypothetical protein
MTLKLTAEQLAGHMAKLADSTLRHIEAIEPRNSEASIAARAELARRELPESEQLEANR